MDPDATSTAGGRAAPRDQQASLLARVESLEEKAKPRRKTAIDHVKEWGGVATLLIALLYTFPLGLWDRFIVSEQTRIANEVASLRQIALTLANEEAQFASGFESIQSDQLRNFYSRAMSTRRYIQISHNFAKIDEYSIYLEAPEIVYLAYTIGQAGRWALADKLFALALEKARQADDRSLIADIYRLKASQSLGDPSGVDIETVRENFYNSIRYLQDVHADGARLQQSNSAFEWALLEKTHGDWGCGEALGEWALSTISSIPPLSPQVHSYLAEFQRNTRDLRPGPDQSRDGCPEQYRDIFE